MIKNLPLWEDCIKNNQDPYGKCCVDVAKRAMEILDNLEGQEFDANDIIAQADRELDEGITGFMEGMVASIISQCHSMGEEFRKSWNAYYDEQPRKGVINPALLCVAKK